MEDAVNFTIVAIIGIAGFLTLVAGLGVTIYFRIRGGDYQITGIELIIGVPLSIVIVAAVGWIAYQIAFNNKITYHEYWNGWELRAEEQVNNCTKDGSCTHTYWCDFYWDTEYYECGDSKHSKTCSRQVEKHHDCPYATQEFTHVVKTTLGDYRIDENVFAVSPVEWRSGNGIPSGVQRGPSQFWTDAKLRCESGNPGPVTKRSDYANYLLASDSVLKAKSSDVDMYKKAGLLPDLQRGIAWPYFADKVYFVGFKPTDIATWELKEAKLNSAVGNELQGDLHVLVTQNETIDGNPDAYLLALKAYWQNPDIYGKDAISKNSIIVVFGTDGTTVTWARAITGMPSGNEKMLVAIQSSFTRKNIQLTSEAILGTVQGQIYTKTKSDGSTKPDVKAIHTQPVGLLEDIIFGLSDPNTRFVRQSMTGNTGASGGYTYQANDIQLDFGQTAGICFLSFLVSLVVWAILAYLPLGEMIDSRRY